MARQTDTRDRLLRAASAVVQERGAVALTLDAVSEAAGVSKGGLLYHFPSKDALHEALLDRLLTGTDGEIAARVAADSGSETGRFTRAFVQASFMPGVVAAYGPAFLATVAARPDLLDAARERYDEWQRQAEGDGLPPAVATAVRLAADGAFFADLLGLAPPEGAEREAVLEFLLSLCASAPDPGAKSTRP